MGQLEGSGHWLSGPAGADNTVPKFDLAVRAGSDLAIFRDTTGGGPTARLVQFSAQGIVQSFQIGLPRCTHAAYVAVANDPTVPERVLLYDQIQKSVGSVEVSSSGTYKTGPWTKPYGGTWTHVTATWSGRIVFHNSANGDVAWGHLDKTGMYVHDGFVNLSKGGLGYDQIVPAGNEYVIFYQKTAKGAFKAGDWELVRVDAVFQPVQKDGSLRLLDNARLGPSALGLVLAYKAGTGEATAFGVFDPDSSSLAADEDLRVYPLGAFPLGWDHIVPLGLL